MKVFFSCFVLLLAALMSSDFAAVRASSDSREGSATRSPSSRPSSQTKAAGRKASSTDHAQTRRLREGTVINDQVGYFREDGDGASFVADTGLEFGALQNLNLERVVRLLKNAEEPSSIRWSVTGEVTEFAGRNYLLIKRAVYKAATPPPAPDRVVR